MRLRGTVSTIQGGIWLQRAGSEAHGRLRLGALTAIGPRLVPRHRWRGFTGATGGGRTGGGKWRKKRKTKRNPRLDGLSRSTELLLSVSIDKRVPPAARIAFLSANSRGVRVSSWIWARTSTGLKVRDKIVPMIQSLWRGLRAPRIVIVLLKKWFERCSFFYFIFSLLFSCSRGWERERVNVRVLCTLRGISKLA